ncbi:MBL fold metallo-hydrolase [Pedobacter sp. Leaf194]|uniref:MBL fold metallo-hydrolase n=1 Tax=Pedobacter sp. Leaf194 TaxID=1736297 RepID=UPI00138EFEF9|nr:MBL fold metallo-hydrolase [Pedobacter sp. Leaf194]
MRKQVNATYLGGPTVILELEGMRIMSDPTLDPKGKSFQISPKVAETKFEGPAIEPGKIDLVLLSHDQHHDNLDDLGRAFLEKVPLTITTLSGSKRIKNNTKGLLPWESHKILAPTGAEIIITATPARHGPAGSEKLTGEVIGFLVSVKGNSQPLFYLTGDTVFYDGIETVAKKSAPLIVFIFAGAAQPRGPFNVTMNSNDAIDTSIAFEKSIVIPLHYEGWSHYTEGETVLKEAFEIMGIEKRLMFLQLGKTVPLPFYYS